MHLWKAGSFIAIRGKRTIAILTGGGHVPGLNPCIKQLVVRAAPLDVKILGIRKAWKGLMALADGRDVCVHIQSLDAAGVRTIDRSGGAILHTSRTNPGAVSHPDAPDFLKETLRMLTVADISATAGGAKRVDVEAIYG